eukprot:Opistho-2@6966
MQGHTVVNIAPPNLKILVNVARTAPQRRLFREKQIVLLAICAICFGAFLFVPDLRAERYDSEGTPRRQDEGAAAGDIDSQHSTESPRLDPQTKERRVFVKKMMKHAWDGYVKHAWGHNELRPASLSFHDTDIFGRAPMGATIVDSLDTLLIMGLFDEYEVAKKWCLEELSFDKHIQVSLFEYNIRFLGGLLTAYALTGEMGFVKKAKELGDRLMPAFNTPTGLPQGLINLASGHSSNYGWAGGSSILAEVGTLDLEFRYLSDASGDPKFAEKVQKVRDHLDRIDKPSGMYANFMNPFHGSWSSSHASLGALGDSFYEYLIKGWLVSGKTDEQARRMYDAAIEAILRNMLRRPPAGQEGLTYVAEWQGGIVEHKMDHLACFAGGMFAIGARDQSEEIFQIGADVTSTCHESYKQRASGIGPEAMRFNPNTYTFTDGNNQYILRPETAESYFVLYRLTRDQKYRDWGWEMVQAIEKHCRAAAGYAGLSNVQSAHPSQDDVQQSLFMAQTLKYLYLLFSDERLISIDEWVFNTEAHPIPVKPLRGQIPKIRDMLMMVGDL